MPSAPPSWPLASGGSECWRRRCGSCRPIATGRAARNCTEPPGQTELFNEAEALVELNEALGAEVTLKATPQREEKSNSATKGGRKAIAAHLPRVPIVCEIPESERQCACGGALIEIGSEVSEQLDYVPPKIQVLQHVRKKYACPGCEQCLKSAPLPAQILPRTNAAPGLLAQLVASKYVDALPLYRQEAIFARYGVHSFLGPRRPPGSLRSPSGFSR
jgi:transposase